MLCFMPFKLQDKLRSLQIFKKGASLLGDEISVILTEKINFGSRGVEKVSKNKTRK